MRKPVVALGLVAAMALSINGAQPASPQTGGGEDGERPNVLIFMTDDQRQGLEVMRSLRRNLEDNGRIYPNAYVTTPSCCPSRASIMTGRYAHNHRVENNLQKERLDHRSTIQFYLQREGYRTGYIGKFLNGWPLSVGPPFFNNWAINAPDTTNRKKRYYGGKFNVNGVIRRPRSYSTNYFADHAVNFLKKTDDVDDSRPWLLFVAPNAPHPPYVPEKKYEGTRVPRWNGNPATREKDLSDKPAWVLKDTVSFKKGRRVRAEQYRMLKSVDDMVQDVMTALRNQEEVRETLVFFISDNGYAWGEHGLLSKFSPYKESVEVPLLARWPTHISPDSRDNRLVANIDIAPTVVQATGITPTGPAMDGRSLLDDSWDRDRLLLEYKKHPYYPSPDWASTITKSYQYTEYYKRGERVAREYYDLFADRYQLKNLLGDGDPLNDPPIAPALSVVLNQDRSCEAGTCP